MVTYCFTRNTNCINCFYVRKINIKSFECFLQESNIKCYVVSNKTIISNKLDDSLNSFYNRNTFPFYYFII